VVAAYDEHWRQKQPEMDRIFSAQVPPLERLSKWCDYIYENQKKKSELYGHVCGCPYASVGGEIATQDDKIRQKAEELIARGAKYLESALADAKREGSVSIKDPAATAQQVTSFCLGTLLRAKIQNDVEVIKDIEPTIMAIVGAKAEVPV
jgi:TetR/AcrR family transcriptional repressor of nem operon